MEYSSRIAMMLMLDLNECIDRLSMAFCVRWHGHVLRREDDHVLRRGLHFEVEGQGQKKRLKRKWKKQVEEESVEVGLSREDELCWSDWSVGIRQIVTGLT